ncbi:MAG: hypothetical protein MUC72_07780 [Acidobacteria bacterium]|jgi:hypothetical protein|nr:hypothetical protein [Acidobacteriota bacterium]
MKLERSIGIDIDAAIVRERVSTYFALSGYMQATMQPQLMTYQRPGSFPGWTPKDWKVNVIIQIVSSPAQPTQVVVAFDIDTSGQFVIKSERQYWQNELDNIEQAIRTGKVDAAASAEKNRPLFAKSRIASAAVIGLAIIGLAIIWAIARFIF